MAYINYKGKKISAHVYNTVVVGSGAAGFNAALSLYCEGVRDVAVVSEGVNMGTSRNTGSDKQTYYKLGMSNFPDSPYAMASDIFGGGCVDGDVAYAEAANSARCFMRLVELGVKFPTNELGEYVGYKTDHDPCSRATSVGPLTSKMMTECLEAAVRERNIPIFDNLFAVEIIKHGDRAAALVALDKKSGCEPMVFGFENIILATGGPAGMYADSVYPECHKGSSGLAFAVGARGKNLTEWQYGLASTHPRWNVSGTYMQVLPTVVSVDGDGNEREFVNDYFGDDGRAMSLLFKKGYEWPFDCNKIKEGSSVIDLLVWYECVVLGRRVYLDYTRNPRGAKELDCSVLDGEARDYLSANEACFGKPVDRLKHMNMPAYELYLSRGVDLAKERLEIALCAQHNNGGIAVDKWWRTSVDGLFAVGELAGTHGVKRPGGSALNAGQVGALRAAQYIAAHTEGEKINLSVLEEITQAPLERLCCESEEMVGESSNAAMIRGVLSKRMSGAAGAIRNRAEMRRLCGDVRDLLSDFSKKVRVADRGELYKAYLLRDTLLSQYLYLCAMEDYIVRGGASRGSAIYLDCVSDFSSLLGFKDADESLLGLVQEIGLDGDKAESLWRAVRPLPDGGGVFEKVWRDYREGNIYNS